MNKKTNFARKVLTARAGKAEWLKGIDIEKEHQLIHAKQSKLPYEKRLIVEDVWRRSKAL